MPLRAQSSRIAGDVQDTPAGKALVGEVRDTIGRIDPLVTVFVGVARAATGPQKAFDELDGVRAVGILMDIRDMARQAYQRVRDLGRASDEDLGLMATAVASQLTIIEVDAGLSARNLGLGLQVDFAGIQTALSKLRQLVADAEPVDGGA